MPYTFTARNAKDSPELKAIAAVCPESTEFLSQLNQVQRRLLRRGNWWDTEWLVRFCVHDNCVTWPRWVATVLGVRPCGSDAAQMFNQWYSIIGPTCRDTFCGNIAITSINTAPTYNTVSGTTGRLIRYYVTKQNDIGKTITIFGRKYGGEPLQELDSDGNWQMGLTLTAAAPFVSSSTLVTQIDAITRQATQGQARLYEYDPDTDLLRDLAVFDPNETNPRYRRSRIDSVCGMSACEDSNGVKQYQIEALIKLEFIPLVNDNDFLVIDNFDALKLGIQALRLEESNDEQLAEVKWLKAIREMNMEDRNRMPDDQTPVRTNFTGGSVIRNAY